MSGSDFSEQLVPCHESGLGVDAAEIIFPASRVPDDILLLMLEEATSISEDELLGDTPWNLAAVCTRWRRLAISCATIWSRVELALFDGPEQTRTKLDEETALLRCHRALIQLERAKTHPLACHMDLPETNECTFEHPFVLSVVRQIVGQLHRCTQITIYGGPPAWDLFSSRPSSRLTLLRRLHYVRSRFGGYQEQLPPFFESTPVLEHLALRSIATPPSFPRAWKSLTALELTRCRLTSRELVDLLSFTENLVKLSIAGVARPGFPIPEVMMMNANGQHHPTAVLPQLTELNVHFCPAYYWPADTSSNSGWLFLPTSSIPIAIRHLRCPNLTAVHIYDPVVQGSTNDIQEALTCLLSSGNPSSVRAITFDMGRSHSDHQLVSDSIIDLLSQLPCLEHIRIQDVPEEIWFGKVLDALRSFKHRVHRDRRDPEEPSSAPGHTQPLSHDTQDQPWLAPHLCRLELVRCHSVDYDNLLDLILRRSASALRHVVLKDLRFSNEELYECSMEQIDQLLRCEPGIERLETLQIS